MPVAQASQSRWKVFAWMTEAGRWQAPSRPQEGSRITSVRVPSWSNRPTAK